MKRVLIRGLLFALAVVGIAHTTDTMLSAPAVASVDSTLAIAEGAQCTEQAEDVLFVGCGGFF